MGGNTGTPTPWAIRAFYPMMIVPGIVLLLAPSTVEGIMEYFGFRESIGGLLQVFYFAGGMFGILAITRLAQRFSVRDIAVTHVLVLSGSLLAASFAPWYPMLLAFYMVAGFANGLLIAFPGVYVTRTRGEHSHREQNILYAFFSLGVVIGPVIAGLAMGDDPAMWRWVFRVPAIAAIPLSVPIVFARFERLDDVTPFSRDAVRKVLAFNSRLYFGLMASLVLYIAAEAAVSLWMVTFFHEKYAVEVGNAHWVLTGLWIGITVGRVICGRLATRIDPFKILVVITAGAAVLLLIAPLVPNKYASMALYPAVGLFYSGIYTFLIGYAALFPPRLSAVVFATFIAAGAVGGAFLPYVIGLVNEFTGLVAGMCLISVPIAGVLVCLYFLRPLVGTGGTAHDFDFAGPA